MTQVITRRRFLGRITAGIGAAIGLVWAIPGVAGVLGSARKPETAAEWRTLGSVDKVQPGIPALFKTRVTKTTGWVTDEREVSVYVFTEDGRDYVGLSNICTHLGCRVRWVDTEQQFFCPCHVGILAKDGTVVAGPPPRPLDRYEVRIQDAQIQAMIDA
jgi:menaquinol-cytochrome c reductase iron-sulfur subunit